MAWQYGHGRSILNRGRNLGHCRGNGMSGKGSSPRPFSVSQQEFDANWNRIFPNSRRDLEDAAAEDEAFKQIEERNERTLGREVPPPNS